MVPHCRWGASVRRAAVGREWGLQPSRLPEGGLRCPGWCTETAQRAMHIRHCTAHPYAAAGPHLPACLALLAGAGCLHIGHRAAWQGADCRVFMHEPAGPGPPAGQPARWAGWQGAACSARQLRCAVAMTSQFPLQVRTDWSGRIGTVCMPHRQLLCSPQPRRYLRNSTLCAERKLLHSQLARPAITHPGVFVCSRRGVAEPRPA